jgi:hypothetical protein
LYWSASISISRCATQRAEVAFQIVVIGRLRHEEPHDERGVDELPESGLLEHVVLRTEHVCRRNLSAEHETDAIERPADERQRDLRALEERLQPLDRRVMAA